MPRVVLQDVRAILPVGSNLTDVQLLASISAATCLIDRVEGEISLNLNDACLKEAERYLSAHYAAVTENTLSISSEDDACSGSKVSYGFKFGEGVMGTPFGQMANTMTSGMLAQYDKAPINFFSIGSI